MYLEKLEIHGFKSFAEKTKFAFSNGITVIVGPNGSGKSNIADALRWVLGEQSIKTLRGGKIEDIIFAGANNRKPLGMAEVSLVLNNETGLFPIAFSAVKVTRRVYRSGESEYLINDTPCRLKDIYDLFADSGLGKEALAIVGQGKIDEILSVRAEDRRGIIEEAAGITRYRNRKKEAERKLHNTERDLERIADILITLEERIDPLTEQKQKAEQYITLNSELKELELQALLQQLTDADSRKQKLTDTIQQSKAEKLLKETNVRTLEAELEARRLLLLKDEENVSLLQQNLFNTTNEWEKMQGELKLTEEKVFFIDEKLHDNNTLIANLGQNLNQLNEKQVLVSSVLVEKEATNEELSLRLQDLQNQKNSKTRQLQEYEVKLEELKLNAFDAAQELSSAKNNVLNANRNNEITRHKISALENKIKQLRSEYSSLENYYNEQKSTYTKLTECLATININEKELKETIQTLQQKQSNLAAAILEKTTNAESAKKQHNFYVEMENKHEGYGHAVRVLLEARDKGNSAFEALHGTVADIIKVDSKYETAIETALGGAIQNVIVDKEQDASKAIDFLKKNNSGRATFLPLSVIKGDRIKPARQYLVASEVVSSHERYRDILEFLLGRTLITENMKEAISVAKETAHRYKIVTLDGDVIFPGGSMSGGSSPKKQTSFLARKRLIDELAKKVEDLRKETLVMRKQAEDNLSLQKAQEHNFSELTAKKEDVFEKISQNDKELALLQQRITSLDKEINENNLEYQFLLSEEKNISETIQIADSDVHIKQQIYENISVEIEDINELMRNTRLENDTENNDLMELNTKLARLDEEIKVKHLELQSISRDIIEKNNEIQRLEKEKNKLTADKKEKLVFINDINKKLESSFLQRTELENLLQNAKEQKQHKQMESFEDEQKLKVLQKQLATLYDDIHAKEIRFAKIEAETDALEERLREDYLSTLSEAEKELKPDFNKKTSLERIKYLQQEISVLGNINLDAIEEHKQVVERFIFLKEQKADLKAAKDSLFKVVEEIEREMCVKFIKTFEAVNSEFQKIFQKIFNGGTAKLTLTDETKILECGIDIIAQPPGKKLQHLMLLSGGEKALTAIALLFAVLRIKPAPFCVLDEIEAALDEANVERFATFLKDYSSKTQFIIISHRQGTMEVADTLYGTTMEESGVTKLISVKFDDRMVG